ncbi:MAG: amidase [Pseudomonadota bacterium]
MKLHEYAGLDATGLAALIRRREVSAREVALVANEAIALANPRINAVVETYGDRIDGLDDTALGDGPFRGVPILIKDVRGNEQGRKVEFGSRLAEGYICDGDTHLADMFRAAGLNILGRSNAPEYSIATSTENLLYGNTSTPWREGYSAGGSSGGAAAAVAAGVVPIAHGSDIGGSIRIPASWCGGIGLKPSRGRVSAGPQLDEGGFGLAMNFAQTRTMRDTAALLDCLSVPQAGDPFHIPAPDDSFMSWLTRKPENLRIAWTTAPTMDAPVDAEVAAAVEAAAQKLSDMGHVVEQADLVFDQEAASRMMCAVWFFGFHKTLDRIGEKTGRVPGPDNLEPVTWEIYQRARDMDPYEFLDGLAWINLARREIGRFFSRYDVLLSPSTAQVSQPHGRYGLNLPELSPEEYMVLADEPVQFAFPYNVAGTPAISLPLAMHSNGLPIGVQLGAGPAQEHLLIALGAALEEAMAWADRLPPLHVTKL